MENVLKDAIDFFGEDMQINVAIEELSELIKELCKHKRGCGNKMHIAEEMADVKIILEELEIIFNNKNRVKMWYEDKVKRLERNIAIERIIS